MKTIIAGSRSLILEDSDYEYLDTLNITEVVCGGAKGIDTSGRDYAELRKIPIKVFAANWKKLGRSAGFIRNVEMAVYAEQLVAYWDGISKGTAHMINEAKIHGLILNVIIIK